MAGLYIHIPFCRHKCAYCDFFSAATDQKLFEEYIEALGNEWDMRKHELDGNDVTTLYIGGGTPSILPFKQLDKLFGRLSCDIQIDNLQEVTLESNPEDITRERLQLYQKIGINRISVGIQSFAPSELSAIGRDHTPEASREALRTLSTTGFNYSADLMYGLPGQSILDWEKNLEELLSYSPPHFSAYLLSYEPGTRLYAKMIQGKVEETDEETAREMYQSLCTLSDAAGYHHYEISNLAKPGMEAIHNSAYWDYTPYLGLGPSAHSFTGSIRRFNPIGIKRYINTIQKGVPYVEIDVETDINRFNDYIITSLRTDRGFNPVLATRLFGKDLMERFVRQLDIQLSLGKVENRYDSQGNRYIRIPRKYWLTSDAIMRELIL